MEMEKVKKAADIQLCLTGFYRLPPNYEFHKHLYK